MHSHRMMASVTDGADDDREIRPIIMFSNRLPVSKSQGAWRLSAGGLVTALRPIMCTRKGYWVGWDGGEKDMPRNVPELDTDLCPIKLSRSEVQAYYHGFSNRTLWPLFHDLVQAPVFDRRWWEIYEQINRRFAEQLQSLPGEPSKEPLLWVHDYHLMLVPDLLRRDLPNASISFFLHTPWPPTELFMRLPWREDLMRGLLGADVLSFHTERYRENFVRTCGALLGDVDIDPRHGEIGLPDGRRVRTVANPISIDVEEFATSAGSDETERELNRLQRQFRDRRVLVGVDRLDYTKGIVERLNAVELLLERRKDLRGKVAFIQIAVPSRGAVAEYRDLRAAIEQAIGRINGRFTEPGAEVPIYYLHRGVTRSRLLAYYRLADVFLVTAVKDGMNLVCKEFVVSQAATGGAGALVLSEFTGAALELNEAIPCNPFDAEGLAQRIGEALDLDEADRRRRLESMARRIRGRDIHRWAEREMRAVEDAHGG